MNLTFDLSGTPGPHPRRVNQLPACPQSHGLAVPPVIASLAIPWRLPLGTMMMWEALECQPHLTQLSGQSPSKPLLRLCCMQVFVANHPRPRWCRAPGPGCKSQALWEAKRVVRCQWSGCRAGCHYTGKQPRHCRGLVSVLMFVTVHPAHHVLHLRTYSSVATRD